ncbi:6-pyruvoyl trahydropterin synthase family protein [Muricoccus vinaceus]|uniref:6-carboxy-5,6,7,8-tetrahydropterin synthase n=1 Tax=Muricoccus vinaceus TaxID=424704 RepID=A0ABV6IK98_9PROT
MYSLTVADHVMVAHSFRGEGFGPAQRVHGATFVVEAEFRAPRLDGANLLVDIAAARVELRRILDTFDYDNLDTLPAFAGQNTTTEFLCFHVHGLLCAALREGKLGTGGRDVLAVKVLLRESPLAWAAYEAEVPRTASA